MTFSVDQFRSQIRQGIAQTSLFRVLLPSLKSGPFGGSPSSYALNVICKAANMPGRQMLTTERQYSMHREKITYGFAQEDVSLTFYVLQDYGIKQYFEEWQSLQVNIRGDGASEPAPTVNYKKEYVKDVKIQQLKKDVIFDLSFNFQGPLGLELVGDIVTPDQIAYTCLLEDAFPTTMNAIEFSNEGGLAELNVQLSYTNWQGAPGFSLSSLTGGLIPSIPALQGLG
tara:strand:+ start:290 stop:970 length:681 start_codon:yes stop_codon:yes gene_type:complete